MSARRPQEWCVDSGENGARRPGVVHDRRARINHSLYTSVTTHGITFDFDSIGVMHNSVADGISKCRLTNFEIQPETSNCEQKIMLPVLCLWNTLYGDLVAWNYEAGSTIESEIQAAWDSAAAAVQRYGGYLEAVLQTQSQLAMISGNPGSLGSPSVVANSSPNYQTDTYQTNIAQVKSLVDTLTSMSAQWWSAPDQATQKQLADEANQLGLAK